MDIFSLMALAKANQGGGGGGTVVTPYNLILRYSYFVSNVPQDLALDPSTSFDDILTAMNEKRGINAYLASGDGDDGAVQIEVQSAYANDEEAGITCTYGAIAMNILWYGSDDPSSATINTYNYLNGGWCTIHISESGGTFSVTSMDGVFNSVSKTRIVCDTSNNSLGVNEIQLTGYRTWLVSKTRHTIYTASVITGSPAVLKSIVIEYAGATTPTVTVTDYALS